MNQLPMQNLTMFRSWTKTAQKYMNNIELFQEKLAEHEIYNQFILNELDISYKIIRLSKCVRFVL